MTNKVDVVNRLDKLLNKLILQSNRFIEYAAFPYGLFDLVTYQKTSIKLVYDYEYFVFTKSTKTLMAIRKLLKNGFNEDILILVRSIYENYLSCRYLHENEDQIDDFIANPLNIALAHFNISPSGEIFDRKKNKVGMVENPNAFKMGMDKKYYYDFYDYLSRFAHCNFGIFDSYLVENQNFTSKKIGHEIESRLFALFAFTKVFELVVTVEGEDFIDRRTEKNCYELTKESIQTQETIFDLCIKELSDSNEDTFKFGNRRMKEMLKNMRKSLKEELGSIKK